MNPRVVVGITDKDFGMMELELMWPAVPRVGDTIEWDDDEFSWEATIDKVVWRYDPDNAHPAVWLHASNPRSEPL